MPFLNLNDVNLPYAHNNNESIDELINLLAGDQHEQNTDISVNQQLQTPRHSGPNPQRQPRTSRTEIITELQANPSLRLIFDIISSYFTGPGTSYKIANRIYSLGPNETITLNALVNAAASNNRLDKTSQLQLVGELTSTGMFIVSHPRQNATHIMKNINFHS